MRVGFIVGLHTRDLFIRKRHWIVQNWIQQSVAVYCLLMLMKHDKMFIISVVLSCFSNKAILDSRLRPRCAHDDKVNSAAQPGNALERCVHCPEQPSRRYCQLKYM